MLQDEKRQIGIKVVKVWKTTILCMRQSKELNWPSTFVQAPFHVRKAISNRGFAFHLSNIISVHPRSPSPNAPYITGDLLYTPSVFFM